MTGGRHAKFLLAVGIGLAAGAVSLVAPLSAAARALVAVDVFSFAYVLLLTGFAARVTPDDLRRHAAMEDEGLPLILILALAAVGISSAAIFLVLNAPGGPHHAEAGLALAAVPLSWAMIHALLALHYAHEFYAPDAAGEDAGGLGFPATKAPGLWDFLYFSFGIGMTAQVSDVTVHITALRRRVLLHSTGAFFYNTVILALAVNAAVTLAG
jgi:uncharacterized membrane protein